MFGNTPNFPMLLLTTQSDPKMTAINIHTNSSFVGIIIVLVFPMDGSISELGIPTTTTNIRLHVQGSSVVMVLHVFHQITSLVETNWTIHSNKSVQASILIAKRITITAISIFSYSSQLKKNDCRCISLSSFNTLAREKKLIYR